MNMRPLTRLPALLFAALVAGCIPSGHKAESKTDSIRLYLPLPIVPEILVAKAPDSEFGDMGGRITGFMGGLDPELLPHLAMIDSVARRQCRWKAHENAKIRSRALLGGYYVELLYIDTVAARLGLSDGCEPSMFISGQTFQPLHVSCNYCSDPMPRRRDGRPTDTLVIP